MPAHRVLSVIHGPVFGGAHNQLLMLAPGLREAGIETVAALPPEAAAAAARIEAAGVEVIALPLTSFRATADPRAHARAVGRLRREVRGLRRAIGDRGADIVQVHGVINPHAGLAARAERSAAVWQLLDTRAPMPLRRAAMPAVTRIADAITSWGRALAEAHPGATGLGERCVIVYPPVDPGLVPDEAAAAAARERLGIGAAEVAVGTLGVRNSQKGHEYFVRAAAIVAAAHERSTFRVIGAPSAGHAGHMAAVEREAAKLGLASAGRISFVDPQGEATTLLQALDVFVFSSVPNSEGMPIAILEAMACAKPVVATDVGAVAELVEHEVSGLVVAPNDPEALAAAVGSLVGDPALRRRLGEAGRERAVAEFPLDRLVERHAAAYRAALEHRRGR